MAYKGEHRVNGRSPSLARVPSADGSERAATPLGAALSHVSNGEGMNREQWYAQLSTVNLHIAEIRTHIEQRKLYVATLEDEGPFLDEAVEELLMAERALRAYQHFRQTLMELLAWRYPLVKESEIAEALIAD